MNIKQEVKALVFPESHILNNLTAESSQGPDSPLSWFPSTFTSEEVFSSLVAANGGTIGWIKYLTLPSQKEAVTGSSRIRRLINNKK